jgi:hypothetical protein
MSSGASCYVTLPDAQLDYRTERKDLMMTEQIAGPEPMEAPVTWEKWELELLAGGFPDDLVGVRCDRCGSGAQHAWLLGIGGEMLALCNHHGRENRAGLSAYPHRDYRMLLEVAERIDRENREKALAELAKPVPTSHTTSPMDRAGVPVNAEFRPVPRHTVQWDAEWWAV